MNHDSSICFVSYLPLQEQEIISNQQVLSIAAYTNPLNPDAYPGLRKMEAEVVRLIIADQLNLRLKMEFPE